MKTCFKTLVGVAFLAALTGQAEAKGCLKGAAVGGVGGHVAGGHAILGAAGGCLVGRHMANKKDQQNAAPRDTPSSQRGAVAPTTPVRTN